jgi:hypothetical protein
MWFSWRRTRQAQQESRERMAAQQQVLAFTATFRQETGQTLERHKKTDSR